MSEHFGLPPKVAADLAVQVRRELYQITGRDYEDRSVTCQFCGLNDKCEFAWDHYNTDGDCLAEK